MTATCNNRTARDAYLDAARDCVLAVGVKRTTITDIARRAGVARMTIYRMWPDMNALLADLMVREWLTDIPFDIAGRPTAHSLSQQVVAIVRQLRSHPLFSKIVDVDPELLLPYIFIRRGRTQDQLLELVTGQIKAGQAEKTVRDANAELLARSIILTAHGYVFSVHTFTDRVTAEQLDRELARQIESLLQP